MKLILWLVLGLVVLYILRKKKKPPANRSAAAQPSAASPDAEAMLRCAECGVHLPASEALLDPAGSVFCSDEHRRRHAVH